MPTYEYQCDACEHQFEELQSIKDEPLKKCPKCRKKKLRRLFGTGAGLIFRGSGFYITDYRSESYQKAAKADQPAATSGTDGKADSKGTGETKGSKKSSTDSSKSAD